MTSLVLINACDCWDSARFEKGKVNTAANEKVLRGTMKSTQHEVY